MTNNINEENLISITEHDFVSAFHGVKTKDIPKQIIYSGDIGLLEDIRKNVAVVGVLTPTCDIAEREQSIVKELGQNSFHIVSGLARGCDTVAHKTCIELGGKTIAILPSTLHKIYPEENTDLARQIVDNGGVGAQRIYRRAAKQIRTNQSHY